MRSTTELKQQRIYFRLTFCRAEDGAQTRDPQLGRLVLYRLSYFRILFENSVLSAAPQHNQASLLLHSTGTKVPSVVSKMWVVMDSNHRRRKPADLQSAPFGHSGNHPFTLLFSHHSWFAEPLVGFEPTTPRLQITCSGQLS